MPEATTASAGRSRRLVLPGAALAPLDRWDALGIAAAGAVLFVACVIVSCRKPFFWYDELATRTLVTDPSLGHMIRAIAHGAENNPPLYELLLRPWAAMFGPSELSLRLASTMCFIVAIAVVWTTLRRAFPTRVVAVGVGAGLLGAQSVIDQSAQARFYGLFVLAAALAVACVFEMARREHAAPWLLAANFLAQLVLVYSHLFGGIYSAAMVGALIVVDLTQGRFRPAAYASFALAWIAFLPWIPATMQQASMAKPRNWIRTPGTAEYFEIVTRQTLWLPTVVVAIAALAGIERAFPGDAPPADAACGPSARIKFALLTLGVALIAVVPAIFVFSRLAVSVFVSRYLVPSSLGWTIVVSFLADASAGGHSRVPAGRGAARLTRNAWAGVFLLTLAAPIGKAVALPRLPHPGYEPPTQLENLPVVVESAIDFWPMAHYDRGHTVHYRFPLDWDVAVDTRNAATAAAEYNLMRLYQHEGYFHGEVEDAATFLCTTPKFFVLDRPEYTWFERRIADNPEFMVESMAPLDGDVRVNLVTRIGSHCAASQR